MKLSLGLVIVKGDRRFQFHRRSGAKAVNFCPVVALGSWRYFCWPFLRREWERLVAALALSAERSRR